MGFVRLCLVAETVLKGLGTVRAIALLAVYFPDLVPILDINVLAALGIRPAEGEFAHDKFASLCKRCRTRLRKEPTLSLRHLDKTLYVSGAVKRRHGD